MLESTHDADLHARHVATGTPIARLPLVVRNAADVETLRANSRAVRRLPRKGLQVAIAGFDARQAQKLETRIAAYVRACGCAEGGAAALIAMMAVLASIALQMSARGPRWSDLGGVAAGLLLAVVFGGLGKQIGLTIARLRFERCCDDVIRMIGNK